MTELIQAELKREKGREMLCLKAGESMIEIVRELGKSERLTVIVNGGELGTVTESKERKTLQYTDASGDHTLEVWFITAMTRIPFLWNTVSGIGLLVDGNPVSNSLADPMVYIRDGKPVLWFYTVILFLKSILTGYHNYLIQYPFLTVFLSAALYALPALFLMFFALSYRRKPRLALYAGMTIAALEMADFVWGTIINLQGHQTINSITLALWFAIRVVCLLTLSKGILALRRL